MMNSAVNEDSSMSPSEMLDWFCWVWATEAERFYPPNETAEECIEALDGELTEKQIGIECGQHARAFTTAVERFRSLEQDGFNPRERAEREIERSRNQGLDLPDVDWTWYDETARLGDDDE